MITSGGGKLVLWLFLTAKRPVLYLYVSVEQVYKQYIMSGVAGMGLREKFWLLQCKGGPIILPSNGSSQTIRSWLDNN